MRQRPSSIHMINGATGKTISNEEMLKLVVPLARALIAKGAKGRTVLIVMRNHEQLTSLYYAVLFTGVVPLILDSYTTEYELNYSFKMVDPFLVFCDREKFDDVTEAAKHYGLSPTAIIADDELHQFCAGHSDDLESFVVTAVTPASPALLLRTSGTTGPAKVALITHQGMMANMPIKWAHHTHFPIPKKRVLVLYGARGISYSSMLITCPVYDITMVLSPLNRTPEHIIELIEKFKVTWVPLISKFAMDVASIANPEQLTSLRTVLFAGTSPTPATIAAFKNKLPETSHICNVYASTETHGMASSPDRGAPAGSVGRINNIFQYKLVDSDGNEVLGKHQNGELYLKSDLCMTKGYLNNEEAYRESLAPGGWWKTGDVFYKDENNYLFFAHRKTFLFKCPFTSLYIAPEELEKAIDSVAGVHECVACGSEEGAAAAVVVRPGCDVTREQIHAAVNSTLGEDKRLRGGIAFVDTLPRTHGGKLQRTDCDKMVNDLIKNGQCF